MHSFFRGWRRKCGVAMLVIALAFWCLWVRSLIVIDMFDFAFWGCSHRVVVMDGSLAWDRAYPYTAEQAAFQGPSGIVVSSWVSVRSGGIISIFDLCRDVKWKWRGLGFAHGNDQAWGGITIAVTLIPYWFLAIPLTFLSAYLILWKPRKREGSRPAALLR
ncbi:MAG: hypothetical protein JWP89_3739 [Schlesneria sp.]|nr:hypothetical protein [Schlesneria sp.]